MTGDQWIRSKSKRLALLKLTNARLHDGIGLDGRDSLAAGKQQSRRFVASRLSLVARKLQTTLSAEEKLSKNGREKAG